MWFRPRLRRGRKCPVSAKAYRLRQRYRLGLIPTITQAQPICRSAIQSLPVRIAAPEPHSGIRRLESRPSEDTRCEKGSCAAPKPDDRGAGYIFGKSKGERATENPFAEGRGIQAGIAGDKNHGPIEIPPRGKPEVIHTGSGKDIIPGMGGTGPMVPDPTAVPVPGALWLLLSGAACLGLVARRRRD